MIDESRPAITATNKAILFGDLKAGYTARKAGDSGIKRISELLALKNETGFVLFCRVDGYNTDAGTHLVRSSRSTPECDLPAWPFASVFWKQLNVHDGSDVGRHEFCLCLYRNQHIKRATLSTF